MMTVYIPCDFVYNSILGGRIVDSEKEILLKLYEHYQYRAFFFCGEVEKYFIVDHIVYRASVVSVQLEPPISLTILFQLWLISTLTSKTTAFPDVQISELDPLKFYKVYCT